MKSTAAICALLLAAAPAHAAQHWSVDRTKSKLGFTVSWNKAPYTAVFKSWNADIEFDPADLAHSHANVTIDIASEDSGDSETDSGVKGAEGFGASQFPTAQFKTTSITHKSGDSYVAAGTLSIKGISRSIALPFTLTVSGATAHMAGKAQILRTDFGVGTGEWAKADPVAHEVTVNVDLVATKTAS